ncbi:MAG: ATP-binding cassette domain-containing protein, partial [Oscillospiraceae bacterium]
MNNTFIEIKNLKVYFPIKSGFLQRTTGNVKAVDDVSFNIGENETLGLVGESGCGKSTIGRALVRLNTPCGGEINYKGENILVKEGDELRELRKDMQIIFQDPYSSLNPRHTVKRLISEVLTVQKGLSEKEAHEKVALLMEQVGLNPVYAERYPHEFSGGQRQRVAIARALA